MKSTPAVMETVQQNGRFKLFSSKFPSNIYSILFGCVPLTLLGIQYLLIYKYVSPTRGVGGGGGVEVKVGKNLIAFSLNHANFMNFTARVLC